MLIIKTQGRLGNQLFQYAFAKNLNKILYNDSEEITINYGKSKHANKNYLCEDDNLFNINTLKKTKLKINYIQKIIFWSYLIIKHIFKHKNDLRWQKFLNYFGIYFLQDDVMTDIKFEKSKMKNKIIYGFFASEKYFIDIKDEIKNDFSFSVELNKTNSNFLKQLKKNNSIALCIRRGDYVNNNYFFVCNEKYYYDAIKKVKKEISNPLFVVFSDDIEWVKNNMKLPKNTIFEEQTNNIYTTFYLMINCKNYILSNSTFHWWAQYLSLNNDKIVYAPSIWNTQNNAREIYQDNWNLIDIEK